MGRRFIAQATQMGSSSPVTKLLCLSGAEMSPKQEAHWKSHSLAESEQAGKSCLLVQLRHGGQ